MSRPVLLWLFCALVLGAPAGATGAAKKTPAKPAATGYAQREDVRAFAAEVASESGLSRRDKGGLWQDLVPGQFR